MKNYSGTFAFKTDIGRVRLNNEDQALVLMNEDGEVFLIVCDGMGGSSKGDIASKTALDCMAASFKKKRQHKFYTFDKIWVTQAIKKANTAIYNIADKNPANKGMGSTLVCALISGDRLLVATIGDSRAYLCSKTAGIRQLTEDQTYVQYLVRTGKITPYQALSHPDRHVLMNALGIYPSVDLVINRFPYAGESVLLCSDGLYNQISINEIKNVLLSDERPDEKVMSLIAEANATGGNDNEGVAYWESLANDTNR
jgi:PPM family protein phosphatase